MRLALLGDIHFYRLFVPPWRLLNKRLIGQINLWFNRSRRFDRALLAPVIERIGSIDPEVLLLSGDLTTTALDAEFRDVRRMLEPITSRVRTIAVPGNHDRYTGAAARSRAFETQMGSLAPTKYPHLVQLAERWQLLGLDAAQPRLITSRGRIGCQQLQQFCQLISAMDDDIGLVVLCHYPCMMFDDRKWRWNHRLADAAALLEAVRHAARSKRRIIYLHGHIHCPWAQAAAEFGDAEDKLIMVNAGAPCLRSSGDYPCGQGFWQIDLPSDPSDPVGLTHHLLANVGPENWSTRVDV